MNKSFIGLVELVKNNIFHLSVSVLVVFDECGLLLVYKSKIVSTIPNLFWKFHTQ